MKITSTAAAPPSAPAAGPGKSQETPPGLAKRDLELPPGIAKKLEAGGELPAGIAKRFPVTPPAPAPEPAPAPAPTEPNSTTEGGVDILA